MVKTICYHYALYMITNTFRTKNAADFLSLEVRWSNRIPYTKCLIFYVQAQF